LEVVFSGTEASAFGAPSESDALCVERWPGVSEFMLAEVESTLEFRLEGSGMAITSFVTIVDMGVYEC
jgi:hypothetical protein